MNDEQLSGIFEFTVPRGDIGCALPGLAFLLGAWFPIGTGIALILVAIIAYKYFHPPAFAMEGFRVIDDKIQIGKISDAQKSVVDNIVKKNQGIIDTFKWEMIDEHNIDQVSVVITVQQIGEPKENHFAIDTIAINTQDKTLFVLRNRYFVLDDYFHNICTISKNNVHWLSKDAEVTGTDPNLPILTEYLNYCGEALSDISKNNPNAIKLRFESKQVDGGFTFLMYGLVGVLIADGIKKYRDSKLKGEVKGEVIFTEEFTEKFLFFLENYQVQLVE